MSGSYQVVNGSSADNPGVKPQEHSHGHGAASTSRVSVANNWQQVIIGLIVASGILAVIAVLTYWPISARVDAARGLSPQLAANSTLVTAKLTVVRPVCGYNVLSKVACGSSRARLTSGKNAGATVTVALEPTALSTGLQPGATVRLVEQAPTSSVKSTTYTFYRAARGVSLIWLAAIFALIAVLVAWRRGLLALVSLGFAALVVGGWLLPALLSGQPAIPVTLAAVTLILIVMLYATHGLSMRTSVALLSALVGAGVSALCAWLAVGGAHLGALGSESAATLNLNIPWLNIQQLLAASVIFAGIGTLNDVTITQVSALWELRAAAPTDSRRQLFASAMRIGRDHVASTVYTLVFAYLGSALVLLLAVQLMGGAGAQLLTADDIAEDIVRALVGGIALMLAMPLATLIGALVIEPKTSPRKKRGQVA